MFWLILALVTADLRQLLFGTDSPALPLYTPALDSSAAPARKRPRDITLSAPGSHLLSCQTAHGAAEKGKKMKVEPGTRPALKAHSGMLVEEEEDEDEERSLASLVSREANPARLGSVAVAPRTADAREMDSRPLGQPLALMASASLGYNLSVALVMTHPLSVRHSLHCFCLALKFGPVFLRHFVYMLPTHSSKGQGR